MDDGNGIVSLFFVLFVNHQFAQFATHDINKLTDQPHLSEYPDCYFYGIDVQPSNPEDTFPDNCEFLKGDIKSKKIYLQFLLMNKNNFLLRVSFVDGIPFPDETFDFIYLRMTMIFIEADEWKSVISEIVRVLKKGGWVEFLVIIT